MIRFALAAFGLLLFGLAPSAHAQDFGNCTDRGYLYNFDPRLAAQPCTVITTADIHWHGGVSHLRVIRPTNMPAPDSATYNARITQGANEIGAAMDRMGGTLHLDSNITILVTSYVSPREAATDRDKGIDKGGYQAAAHDTLAHECPISYYKGSYPAQDGGEFIFVLAHEVFHCIQFRTWGHIPDDAWVSEASAEYFAYLAHPSFGAGHIANFDAEIATHALDTMDYAAVPFYLWMGDTYGPSRVRDFIGSTRSIQSAIDSDMWLAFAQRYFGQTIHMPDGRPMPSSPRSGGTVSVHDTMTIGYPPIVPYTLNNTNLAFDRDKLYTLTRDPTPPDFRERWRQASNSAWQEMPPTITTCAGEQRYRVIWATTRSNRAGTVRVRAQPASAGTCSCPAGAWQETDASVHRFFEQSAYGATDKHLMSGGRLLQLNPDHTGSFTYQNVVVELHSSDPRIWLHQTQTGGTHFTWRVLNGTLYTFLVHGNNLLNLHNESHSPLGVTISDLPGGVQSIGHQVFCDGSGLHLRQPLATVISVDMDFTRVGAAPPPEPGH